MKTPPLLLLLLAGEPRIARAELRVPAFTAYLEPDSNGASVSEKSGDHAVEGSAQPGLLVWRVQDAGAAHVRGDAAPAGRSGSRACG